MTVEADVKTHLDAQSLGANVYKGPVRPAQPPALPHKAVFVMESGGLPPSPYMDGGSGAYRFYRVQIRVRSEPNGYNDGKTLADAVWSDIQQAAISGYVRVTCEQSTPLYMGKDETGCYEWSINAVLEKRAA